MCLMHSVLLMKTSLVIFFLAKKNINHDHDLSTFDMKNKTKNNLHQNNLMFFK